MDWTIRISEKSSKESLPIHREAHRSDFHGGVLFDIRFKLVHEARPAPVMRDQTGNAQEYAIDSVIPDAHLGVLLVQLWCFGEFGIVKPSIMSAEISYISDAFDPALKICIANSVCAGNRLLVLVFHVLEKFRQCTEAEKLHQRVHWDFTVHVICLKVPDERELGVAFNFVVYVLDKLFMIADIGKICGVSYPKTPYLQEK